MARLENRATETVAEQNQDIDDSKALSTVVLGAHDIISRCKVDMNFFAATLTPHVCTVPFPVYYSWLWQLLTTHGASPEKVLRFALGLPRSHAKTTFIKLLVVYLILYKKCCFVLIVCANEKLAQNMLEDIDSMLSGELVQKLWGHWKLSLTRDTQTLKRGAFLGQDVILAGLGASSSLRGINIANRRPDFIIMDDIQTRENALSQAENSTLYSWMLATLLKARDFQKCVIVFIGNMYTKDCILYKLKLHRKWQSFITGAILNDWAPLWPEYFTIEDLLDEYEHDNECGEAEIWFAEVMNIPIGGNQDLIPGGKIPLTPIGEMDEAEGGFITIDPSGYRTKSDDTVVQVHQIFYPMHYQLRDMKHGVMNPEETIKATIDFCIQYNIGIVGVETVAYQQSLKFWMEKIMKEMELDIVVVELQPQGRHKTTRIKAFIKELLKGDYSLHKEVRSAFLFQALAFKPERTDNKDDILDDAAYGLDMRAKYHDQILWLAQQGINIFKRPTRTARVMAGNSFLDRR